jgi:hypothetical protein
MSGQKEEFSIMRSRKEKARYLRASGWCRTNMGFVAMFCMAAFLPLSRAYATEPTSVITYINSLIGFGPTGQGIAQIQLPAAVPGQPSCVKVAGTYAIDLSTPAGRAIFAEALTAHALGKQVTIEGNDSCNVFPGSETVVGLIF